MKSAKKLWIGGIVVLLVLCMVATCLLPWNRTEEEDIHVSLWIDPVNGNDANAGTTEATALKTISAATAKAAEMSETSDIVVCLKGGTYAEGQAITFGSAESGRNGHTITYKAAAGETPIISGGTLLENWTLYDPLNNIYVTDVPEGAELVRQFYVDGKPMPNAAMEYSSTDWEWLSSAGYMSPYVDSADSNEYLILDLGEENPVSSVTMYSGSREDADGKAAGFPRDFTISASVDGKNWVILAEQTDCAAPDTRSPVTISFDMQNARYVKIDITELGTSEAMRSGQFNVSLSEVMVGLAKDSAALDLSIVQHLDPENNLITAENVRIGCYEESVWKDHALIGVESLIDGDKTTCVSTESHNPKISTPAYLIDIQADGYAVSVGAVYLAVREDAVGAPTAFEIQISTDGSTWNTVVSEEAFSWAACGYEKIFTFNPCAASFVRILAHETAADDSGSNYLQFAEAAVYKPADVSVGATVTAPNNDSPDSTWDKDYLANGLFDGIYTSGAASSPSSLDAPVTLDLNETQTIAGVRLYPRYSGSEPLQYVSSVRISVSEDGQTFQTVLELAGIEAPDSGAQLFVFPEAVDARYVRIEPLVTVPGPGENTNRFQLQEIEVAPAGVSAPEGNIIPDCLSVQGESVTYNVVSITVKNDNTENRYNANKAIDSFVEATSNYGWLVPEDIDLTGIGNITDMEIHTLALWYHTFELAAGISSDGTELYATTHSWYPTWLANAYAFIDTTGEWYMNRTEGKLYYKADGTMEGKEAILPVAEQVIYMEGASNIIFDGITFEHTSYTLPSEIGYQDAQANTQGYGDSWKQVDGGIMLDSCQNITITNCVIRNMGTAGIKVRSIASRSDDITITNNRIYDISYNGITIGEVYKHNGYEKWQLVTDTVIRNNYITRVGLDMYDSCGITATYTNGTIIDHNEIAYCPYTGISTGWGWCNDNEDAAAEVGNLQITNNFIHDTGKVNRDGGSIYNLGSSTGTVISGNYVCNSWDGKSTREQGIYLDEGSSNIEVSGNVVGNNVRCWMYQWQASIQNNYWHDNFYSADATGLDKGTNTKLENNTAVEEGKFEDYPDAQKIIDNAGLLDQALKDGIENGFAPEHQIVQKIYKNNTCRYMVKSWGWQNVQIAEQSGRTMYDRVAYEISIVVPSGTDVTSLALTYELESGFSCDKVSGSVQDFSNPVTYTMTKGSNTIVWTVVVKTEP